MTSVNVKKREKLSEFFLLLAFLFITFVAALIVFAWLGFLAGRPLTRLQPLTALASTLLLPFLLKRQFPQLNLVHRLIAVAAFTAAVGCALLISASFSDVTADGQGYQGIGVVQVLEGWNPIREPERADTLDSGVRLTMVHFAKGCWISGAGLSALLGRVEAGKAGTLLLMTATFCLALHTALKYSRLTPTKSILLGALLSFNPISLNQCLSFYVDGQLAALFASLALGSCLLLRSRTPIYFIVTTLTILMLINVKLTAPVYVCAFGTVFAGAISLLGKSAALPRLAAAYLTGIVLGVAVGYNPYVTNLKETGNPFYPFGLRGGEQFIRENFEEHQMPVAFRERSRLDALARSIFGRCNNDYDYSSGTFSGGPLKIPFSVGADEIKCFADVDTRICGWGPLTSGILLVAAIALLLVGRKEVGPHLPLLLAVAGCILVTMLAIPHPWYARYAPQLWILPGLAVAVLWLSAARPAQLLAAILAILMFANLAMIAAPCFHSAGTKTTLLRSQLRSLSKEKRLHAVYFGSHGLNRRRFDEFRISYRPVNQIQLNAKQLDLVGEVLGAKTVVLIDD